MRASQAMKREVLTVPPECSLRVVWAAMKKHRFRHFPVVASGRLVGILSDRDIIARAHWAEGELVVPKINAAAAMTRDPITCPPDCSVETLALLMLDKKIDALPIVEPEGKLVGLVTSSDLISLLTRKNGTRVLPFEWELKPINVRGLAAVA